MPVLGGIEIKTANLQTVEKFFIFTETPYKYIFIKLKGGEDVPEDLCLPSSALYIIDGSLKIKNSEILNPGDAVLCEGTEVVLKATAPSSLLMVGLEQSSGL